MRTIKILGIGIIFLLLLFSIGCKKDEELEYPDIEGTWNLTLNFTSNTCPDSDGNVNLVIVVQSGEIKDSGQIQIFLASNTNCPEWIVNYTLTTDGTLAVNESGSIWDPNECQQDPYPGTRGNITINAEGCTATSMNGDFSIHLYHQTEAWFCDQEATWVAQR